MSAHLFLKLRKPRAKGQALVEFALVFPIFLILVLGVIELAHLIFIYSSVYVSSREAARYGAAAGTNGSTPYYRDCAGMRAAAQRVGEYGGVTNATLPPAQIGSNNTGVAIQLVKNGSNTPTDYSSCPNVEVALGDRLQVTTQVFYEPIVPLVPIPSFPVSHTSIRTILRNVDLEKIDPGSPPVADTYGVILSTPDDSKLGIAGTEVTYDLEVTNTGSIFDTYTLSLSGNGWTTTLVSAVSVVPGETVVVPVVVSVPTPVGHGQIDTVYITATSIGDPGVPPASDTLSLTTTAPTYGVDLTVPDNTLGGQPGQTVTYNVSIRNIGNVDDTFTLSISGNNWPTMVEASVSVAAGATVVRPVTVTIPTEYTGGSTDTAVMSAVSVNDPVTPKASDTLNLTTSGPAYGVNLWTTTPARSGRAGSTVTYTLQVTNLGNLNDSFTLTVSGNNWTSTINVGTVTVAAGATASVTVSVVIPPTATHGDSDRVNITAVSVNDPSTPPASDIQEFITTAFTYGVRLSASPSTIMGTPGGTVTFNVVVTNIGSINDTYTLTIAGNAWSTTVPCGGSVSVAALPAANTVTCPVTVTIPNPVANGASDRVTITAVSTGDPSIPPASHSIALTTNTPRYGVRLTLTVPDDSLSGTPGNPVTYILTVQNTGNVTDTFNLAVSGNTWATTVVPSSVTLAPNASNTNLIVTVNIPSDALHDAVDVATITAYSGDIAAPRASASLSLTTTATRVCPYAGSLGLGAKSMNLLLFNNGVGAENVTIEQINVTWFMNSAQQRLDYIAYLSAHIMDQDVTGPLNTAMTSSFPGAGPWVTGATRALPAGASNYGLNVYFGLNIDTTKTHGIYIRFNNGCFISR